MDRLHKWQARFIESVPTKITTVLLILFMSNSLEVHSKNCKSEARKSAVKKVMDAAILIYRKYDPDGSLYKEHYSTMLALNGTFIRLMSE